MLEKETAFTSFLQVDYRRILTFAKPSLFSIICAKEHTRC